MILSTLLLVLTLAGPAKVPAVADTVRAPKPRPLTPTVERRKPEPAPKGKPVGEPQLKRRKPPPVGFRFE